MEPRQSPTMEMFLSAVETVRGIALDVRTAQTLRRQWERINQMEDAPARRAAIAELLDMMKGGNDGI